jgi:tetratricopeptide (TPR) repeat protein
MKKKVNEKPLRKRKKTVHMKKMTSRAEKTIDRNRVEDELERSREELRSLTRHLQSVREEERTHIAREMHDELGQKLTGLKMDLSGLKKKIPKRDQGIIKKLSDMLDLTDSSIQTVKRISTELRPRVLDDLGLGAAMEWQAGEFERRTGIKCAVKIDPENLELDKELSTSLFRIFQESLTNVARYAEASKVEVRLVKMGGMLELSIQDNGKGIIDEEGSKKKSFGLIGMRERVRYLGGEFTIVADPTSSPSSEAGLTGRQAWRKGSKKKGTTITVKVPLQEAMGRPLQTAPKMVGREKELRRLRILLESVHRRTRIGLPKMVLINGEAGIGKSRLVREVQRDVVSQGGTVLIGNCYEETQSIPYYPFRDALKQFFEINKEEAISIFIKLPDYSQWELAQILPGLRELKSPEFERSSDKYRLFESFRLFFENIGERLESNKHTEPKSGRPSYAQRATAGRHMGPNRVHLPLLLIIEDLHWSDEASLDLLHYLSRNFRETSPMAGHNPILLLGTYRTEDAEPSRGVGKLTSLLQKENLSEEIKLQPLPRDEVSTLLKQLTPGLEQSKQFQVDLYKRTEGNPFFVEELMKYFSRTSVSLVDTGFSKEDLETGIPTSIQGILQRRANSLSPEMKEVLTCGALIGEEFDFEVIRRVLNRTDEEILDAVEGGVQEHFVRESYERGEEGYRFNHSLMSDVLYTGIGKTKRRIWHGKVGEALEEVYAGRLEVLNGQLSYHFEMGEKWEKAVDYALKSANHAKDVYANQEAIRMYEKAREILPRLKVGQTILSVIKTEIAIAEGLGDVYELTCDYEKALQEYRMMEEFARSKGDEKKEGEAISKRAGVYEHQGNYDEALVFEERSYEILRKTDDQNKLAWSLDNVGMIHWRRGNYIKAMKCHEEALKIAREIGNKKFVPKILNSIGIVHEERGNNREAMKYYEEALKGVREIGDKKRERMVLNNIGNVNLTRGDTIKALKCFEGALKINSEIGDRRSAAINLFNIGNVYNTRGEIIEALKYYEESVTIFSEIGDKYYVENNLNNIGVHYWKLGDYRDALKIFENSLAILKKIGSKKTLALSLNNIGVIHFNLGDYGKALNYLKESYRIQKKIDYKMGTAWNLFDLGTLHQFLFNLDQAMQYHKECITLMKEIEANNEMVNVLTEIGTNYFLLGENEESLQYLNEALGIVLEIGSADEPCVLETLSEVWLSKGDFKKSSNYCKRLLKLAEKDGLKGYLVRGRKIKGEILLAEVVSSQFSVVRQKKIKTSANSASLRLKLKRAEKELKEALKIAEEIGAKPQLWQIHASLGKIYSATGARGSNNKAKEQFTKSKVIIQKIASTIGDEKLKKTFLNSKQVRSILENC